MKIDEKSVAGKELIVEEQTQLLVVGAGPAGLAAAIDAARRGLSVVLIDENPVPFITMGNEVPLHYGQGMSPVARNRNAMLESFVASEPLIQTAFEAGVDVRLGTACWGLYANGPGVHWLPGTIAGLADETRGWLIGAEYVIVAAGRRDIGLGFPGWEKPGVMGATAAVSLATRFRALNPRRVLILGTSAEALAAAAALEKAGVEIAGIVEQAAEAVGPVHMVDELRAGGCEFLTRHVVREVLGRDSVEEVLISALDEAGRAVGKERRIACDGVVLAVGATPVIDLLAALGCRVAFQPERGGYAPAVDAGQRTSVRNIFVIGDSAGIWPTKSCDPSIAEREALLAVATILDDLGLAGDHAHDGAPRPDRPAYDLAAYRLAWVHASVIAARDEFHVCQCEEITAREILELRPPRYLGWQTERRNDRSLSTLLGDAPPNPDQVKRLTRAGMGPCQGRRCREQIAALLAMQSGASLAAIPLAGYRAPVRPLPLEIASQIPESPDQARHWALWFGIPSQWKAQWEVPEFYTVATDHVTTAAALDERGGHD
ncbi:FAD-dependent oxidoreductase [Mesorhizobium sp. M7A.F.Ca.CA.001.07.2.1]|uniref:NAD(P)/FAD-dependent oxidoreductase n=1 Tax=Mesorhizobium TaxID=68287 RepID=UPI000FCBD06A|nr:MULTISPECIES: NAD(P)/FAD-dependent oxidoreductase [Mesorhizobium]RWN85668.1 MAG: FAD-dependent oxidoreductase [Mesorhizobium sp.]MCF6127968.1 FAD-dependent oxidoreductase [Mesorhizobium ciceri]MCQ8818568.1 FAD-dependent oxidoreductase [Mesorhizobium sp. SEMIA396]RUU76911.1 FAD-dependent oxidoreductase [Mesorhizobium sp. M7A.F.Ca.MR.362.00.0.0]RUX70264.1 FAD-dependent oxidoreductase [Mesorhizobium sp. M7A.F.Ca.CA.004.08.2.1]